MAHIALTLRFDYQWNNRQDEDEKKKHSLDNGGDSRTLQLFAVTRVCLGADAAL